MKRLPKDHIDYTDKVSETWAVGHIWTWATGFSEPSWLVQNYRISIRPGETGKQAYERELKKPLHKDDRVIYIDR